jgi:hypothetical protein
MRDDAERQKQRRRTKMCNFVYKAVIVVLVLLFSTFLGTECVKADSYYRL